MREFGVFTSVIVLSIFIAGLYGIMHDQITYSISSEYFTKFKYLQFGFEPAWFGGDRQTVAVIGFLATWWVGAFIGIILGLVSLIFPDHKTMFRYATRSILLTISIAVITGFTGFLYGKFYLTKSGVDWWLPENLIDKNAFITVGSIHNFSYLGGIIGLLISVVYLFRARMKEKRGYANAVSIGS